MKLDRIGDRIRYRLEQMFLGGVPTQLLVVVAVIGLIALAGGVTALVTTGEFPTLGEATWWAFLRLTDPGYLGDDEGTIRRTVSTVLTVAGYVVFLGALVAIMTQWLTATMRSLESGLTPVRRNGHILVLGTPSRTDNLVRELLVSKGRVRRFLERQGVDELHVVVLTETVSAATVQDLRSAVGEDIWDSKRVTLRQGTPLRVDHLERVDFLHASVILVPAIELGGGGADRADSRTIKTLLSLANHPAIGEDTAVPRVVAEIFDTHKAPVARRCYGGRVEIVSSDAVVSRLLAQNVRHPGLSHIYNELLSHRIGAELYVRHAPELGGRRFEEVVELFPRGICLGMARRGPDESWIPLLNPHPGLILEDSDRVVLLGNSYEATTPEADRAVKPWVRGAPRPPVAPVGPAKRILVLGWNHKVPALLSEFGSYAGEHFEVVMAARFPVSDRAVMLKRYGFDAERLAVTHVEADATMGPELRRLDARACDHVIIMGSDRSDSESESDARTILTWLMLQAELEGVDDPPGVLVELLDPENVALLGARRGEFIVSPVVLSHMVAQVALRRELGAVFEELFTAGGAEIAFRPAEVVTDVATFGDVRRQVFADGEIAMGILRGGEQHGPAALDLAPDSAQAWDPGPGDQLVTLVTY